MADSYNYWRDALAGRNPEIHVDAPQAGRYTMRKERGGRRYPVAIWSNTDGQMVALVGFEGKQTSVEHPDEIWNWCARNPISAEVYNVAVATGRFPDDLPEAAMPPAKMKAPEITSKKADDMTAAAITQAIAADAPLPGHNQPPPDSEFESLKEQLASVKALAASIKTIASEHDNKMAQGYRARLLELGKQLDKRRDALKRPHLEAGRAVDNLWNPLVHDAEDSAGTLRNLMRAWETKKAREATQIRGAYGKAASVRSIRVVTEIDYGVVFTYFKDNAEVQALLKKLAQKAVEADVEVPGVTVESARDVR